MRYLDSGDFIALSVCAVVVLGIGALTIFALIDDGRARTAFMAECRQHRQNFECVAMWRAGQTSTVVMPMPVVIR